MSDNTASRRDFLKLAALGLAGTTGVALGTTKRLPVIGFPGPPSWV